MRVTVTTLLFLCSLAGPPRLASAQETNACGCFRDAAGACKCMNRKLKCECPGDCEPVACEAKRQHDADRDAAATLKKIQVRERKKAAEAARDAKVKAKTRPKKAPDGAKDAAYKEVLPPSGQ
jgi:hypothetical protein